jgi:hypothetical protein
MIAEQSNGVKHARTNRLVAASNGDDDNACHTVPQPSPNGSNGARHDSVPPSTDGENSACKSAEAASTDGDNGRDASGRFTRGNPGGPGNPFGRLMARLRNAFCRGLTEEDVEAIAATLIAKARDGNVAAAKVVLSYGIGKPTEAVNPDTLDMQEWDVYRKSPVSLDDLRGIVEGIPVEAVGPLVRVSKPYLNANAMETIMNVLNPPPKPKRSGKERRAERRRRRMEKTTTAPPVNQPG